MKGQLLLLACVLAYASGEYEFSETEWSQGSGLCFQFIDFLQELKDNVTISSNRKDEYWLGDEVEEFCDIENIEPFKCFILLAHSNLIQLALRNGQSNEEICSLLRNIPIIDQYTDKVGEVDEAEGITCEICERIVGLVKFSLEVFNASETWIKNRIDKLCHLLPLEVQVRECQYIVGKMDSIVQMIFKGMDPGPICKVIGFCDKVDGKNKTANVTKIDCRNYDGQHPHHPRHHRCHNHTHHGLHNRTHHGHHNHQHYNTTHGNYSHHFFPEHHRHHHGRHHHGRHHHGKHHHGKHHHGKHHHGRHHHGRHHHGRHHHGRHHHGRHHHGKHHHGHHHDERPLVVNTGIKKGGGLLRHWFSNFKAKVSPSQIKWKNLLTGRHRIDGASPRIRQMFKGKNRIVGHIWAHLAGHGGLRVHSIDIKMKPCFKKQCLMKKMLQKKLFTAHLCHHCKLVGSVAKHQLSIHNISKDLIVKTVTKFCSRFPPHIRFRLCGRLLEKATGFVKTIKSATTVVQGCSRLGFCGHAPGLPVQSRRVKKVPICAMCSKTKEVLHQILKIYQPMLDETKQKAFELCEQFKNRTDVPYQCAALASIAGNSGQMFETMFLPAVCDVNRCPKRKMASFLMNRNKKNCQSCRKFLHFLKLQLVTAKKSLHFIFNEVDELCHAFDDKETTEKCDKVIQLLKTRLDEVVGKLNPDGICVAFRMCPKTIELSNKLANNYLNKFRKILARKQRGERCQLCKITVGFIRQSAMLQEPINETKAIIQEAYRNASHPSDEVNLLNSIDVIRRPSARKIAPTKVCQKIRLCQGPLVKPNTKLWPGFRPGGRRPKGGNKRSRLGKKQPGGKWKRGKGKRPRRPDPRAKSMRPGNRWRPG